MEVRAVEMHSYQYNHRRSRHDAITASQQATALPITQQPVTRPRQPG
jgi:hypothetical protein